MKWINTIISIKIVSLIEKLKMNDECKPIIIKNEFLMFFALNNCPIIK